VFLTDLKNHGLFVK